MQSNPSLALEILNRGDLPEVRALLAFDSTTSNDEVLIKFQLWARWFFPQYFKHQDAPFHKDIDLFNLKVYRGELREFVNVAFRGAAKTTRTKLFWAFTIANDIEHTRKYKKVLTKDVTNATQSVTDIYNMLINTAIRHYYPEIFVKTTEKREEKMSSFTTSTGVKVRAGTVGTEQRGQLQEDSRPDEIWFDDFETRKTLRSAVETQAIFDNMEEARNGLAKGGGAVYTCNYISERGNVHRLVRKIEGREVLIVPIIKDGVPTWSAYTLGDIETIRSNADDFEGEYLCEPAAGHDVFIERSAIDAQVQRTPIRESSGFKMFYGYNPSHRYGIGADVAGGVGLDSSTSVVIDFGTMPNRVVATFESNTIEPDIFGHELIREADFYGNPVIAPENNKFDMCIGVLKAAEYEHIYFTEQADKKVILGRSPMHTYGWNTNATTKPKMLFDLKKAVEDGQLELSDPNLIAEARSYSRDDLMDRDEDVRLTTRHFDLLIAAAIAFQMRNIAPIAKNPEQRAQDYFEARRNLSSSAR
jgi:hypothetical protein